MIGVIGTVTAAQAMTWCEANGTTAADCQLDINAQTVNGVFCDGDVNTSLDANGNKVVTCTPTGAIEAQIAAIQADCLAHCGQTRTPAIDAECVPYCGDGTGGVSGSTGMLLLGALAGLAGLAVWSLVR